ncbi:site-specific tyrosine recombinase/integron integrase [Candidatus Deianiraea vastatrix]|uniref:Tyrosine recombinase XerD n=1 Tax=Candidatus Deianiraea vastatrix TaxID=2163644 RepID=A0A5B8XF23_9RICK|nr:site-specific tyrosine recombinase/integron integrase [Candidatus Deianiraea vastatrix]QED23860.1 Tyrosine recombinase XerD [Candidatus Deianiraea vastatrix]
MVEKFLKYCKIELNLSKNTLIAYKKDLENFMEYLPSDIEIVNVKNTDIENYFLTIKQNSKCRASSICRKISTLSHFFKFLISENIINTSPIINIQKPKKESHIPHFLTDEEVAKMIEVAKEDEKNGKKHAAIIALLFASGMRVSELCVLKISQLEIDKSQIRVIGKGNKERIVPVSNNAISILNEYLEDLQSSIFLFPSVRSNHISRIHVGNILKNIAKMANIDAKKVHPHALRHSIALKLVNSGMDLRLVQEFLGHKDISTTAIYTHVNSKEIVDLVKKYHPMSKDNAEGNDGNLVKNL